MKKVVYLLLTLIGFTYTSCDPLEDINAELDANNELIVGEVALELTDEDYEDLDLQYGNFNSVDDAKNMIPGLLEDKYPVWGDGSLATVTFKWHNPIDTFSEDVYELTEGEHNTITGNNYGNFDRDYHIFDYIEANYTSPEEGDFVSLRYNFYAGTETTLTDGFYFDGTDWNKIEGFTPAQYNAMEEGYPNFSSHDEAEIKIPIALVDKFKFSPKSANDIVSVMYELYEGGGVTKSYTSNFLFDGTVWSKYNDVANETIKFGHDGTVWVPDNTIKYTLTSDDYELVGNGFYQNFDVRPGKDEETVEARLAKINTILLNNFPEMEEGQKFVVTYNVYNNANEIWEMKVILTGGAYILQ